MVTPTPLGQASAPPTAPHTPILVAGGVQPLLPVVTPVQQGDRSGRPDPPPRHGQRPQELLEAHEHHVAEIRARTQQLEQQREGMRWQGVWVMGRHLWGCNKPRGGELGGGCAEPPWPLNILQGCAGSWRRWGPGQLQPLTLSRRNGSGAGPWRCCGMVSDGCRMEGEPWPGDRALHPSGGAPREQSSPHQGALGPSPPPPIFQFPPQGHPPPRRPPASRRAARRRGQVRGCGCRQSPAEPQQWLMPGLRQGPAPVLPARRGTRHGHPGPALPPPDGGHGAGERNHGAAWRQEDG